MSRQQIQDTIAVFHAVFNAAVNNLRPGIINSILEYAPNPNLSDLPHGKIPQVYPVITHPLPTIISLQYESKGWPVDVPLPVGPAAFPPGVPHDIAQGILKINRCDWSVYPLLPLVQQQLSGVGAKVEWLQVAPKPKSIFLPTHANRESYVKTIKGFIMHSVYLITSAEGVKYVADFTIEQFGFPASEWFFERGVYLREFVADPQRWRLRDPETFREKFCGMPEWCEPMREFCEVMDWRLLEKMGRVEREKWVWEEALRALRIKPVTLREKMAALAAAI